MAANTMKTVALITLGCKVNQYETDGMAQKLKEAGYQIVPLETGADITIVNTCAVTNMAQRKSRQMMSRAKKKNPDTILVAAGCYIQNAEKTLDELKEVDIFLGNNQKHEIVKYIEEYLKSHSQTSHLIDINHTSEYEEFSLASTAEHTRAYVKIQDGCNQFCSYCIIPYVRGRVRSRNSDDIVKEAKKLVKDGYQEIVLTGIHISSYGVDKPEEGDLLSLLKKLHEIESLKRIRLGSLEPRIITTEFVQAIVSMPKICPHFHLSLQSGTDATLKRMNRHYTCEEYAQKVALLRKYYTLPAITTDVIVGFPGESEEDFEQTYRYLETLNLYEMHIFKYSVREGTNAAKMPDQIDGSIKQKRSEALLELTQRQKKDYEEHFLGEVEEVLFEEVIEQNGESYVVGHTMRYVKVAVKKSEKNIINCICPVKLQSRLNKDYIFGEIL